MMLDLADNYVLHGSAYWRCLYASPNVKKRQGEVASKMGRFTKPSCPNWPEEHPAVGGAEIVGYYLISKKPASLMWCFETLVLSDSLAELISGQGFSGFRIEPIDLFTSESGKVRLDGYKKLTVDGRVEVDLDQSRIEIEYECPICGFISYGCWDETSGLHFKEGSESMPDMFLATPEVGSFVFASGRLAQFLIDTGVDRLTVARIEDFAPVVARQCAEYEAD